jgi:leader peptidase (prepilin peptidase)/N-methyltransferase
VPHPAALVAIVGGRSAAVVAAAVVGLVFGSFLNVVIFRTPRRMSVVRPGSFCPTCETPIRGYDNVPLVSWIVLSGRCRNCRTPISVRYPAVELATAALFALFAWLLGPHWAVPGVCALAATMLVLAVVHLDGAPLPAGVAVAGTLCGAVLLAVAAIADHRWWRLGGMGIGMTAAAAVVGLAGWARRLKTHGATPAWGLLPGGALFGWLGLVGSVVGVAVTLGALVAEHAMRSSPRLGRRYRNPGVGGAVLIAAIAAVVSAWGAGNSPGL